MNYFSNKKIIIAKKNIKNKRERKVRNVNGSHGG